MSEQPTVRVGCGAGFSSDRLDPAVDLAARGRLDYLIFECIGERTLAFGHRDRRAQPDKGYNPYLERRLRAVLPHCRQAGTRIVTNMGVANPMGAAERAVAVARELGLKGLKVAAVEGDDVTAAIGPDTAFPEFGMRVKDVGRALIGANAYLGADAILPALEAGADVVITGRVADPSLVVAPLRHSFGWAEDDWLALGRGTLVGHLLECGAQVTGGYFADPGYKDVPDLAHVGYPIAEIADDGSCVIGKPAGTGGLVDVRTVKEQLLYEVHDPAAYLTPDVVADLTAAEVVQVGPDRVRLSGVRGHPRPARLKVNVCFENGWLAEGEISYAGPRAEARARLAADILRRRLDGLGPLRFDLVGVASVFADDDGRWWDSHPAGDARDVRLRVALNHAQREAAEVLVREVTALYTCGPAGGGGVRTALRPRLGIASCLVPREAVPAGYFMVDDQGAPA